MMVWIRVAVDMGAWVFIALASGFNPLFFILAYTGYGDHITGALRLISADSV